MRGGERSSAMETFLRQWRQDSVERHQYDAAIYVGDKLLALTSQTPTLTIISSTTSPPSQQFAPHIRPHIPW